MAGVRGRVVLHAVRFVKETYGEEAHESVIRALSAHACGTLLGPAREASLEPVEDLICYMEVAQRLLAPREADFFRRLGRFSGTLS